MNFFSCQIPTATNMYSILTWLINLCCTLICNHPKSLKQYMMDGTKCVFDTLPLLSPLFNQSSFFSVVPSLVAFL